MLLKAHFSSKKFCVTRQNSFFFIFFFFLMIFPLNLDGNLGVPLDLTWELLKMWRIFFLNNFLVIYWTCTKYFWVLLEKSGEHSNFTFLFLPQKLIHMPQEKVLCVLFNVLHTEKILKYEIYFLYFTTKKVFQNWNIFFLMSKYNKKFSIDYIARYISGFCCRSPKNKI